MMYTISYKSKALKVLATLPVHIQVLIRKKIVHVAKNPYAPNNNIKKMVGSDNRYRLRSGDYRLIYELINDILVLEVVEIGHKKEVYR